MLTRILTGLLLAPLAIVLIYFTPQTGGVALVAIAGFLTIDEYHRLTSPRGRDLFLAVQVLALLLLLGLATQGWGLALTPAVIFIAMGAMIVVRMATPTSLERAASDVAIPALGLVWVGVPLSVITAILFGFLELSAGNAIVLALLAMVFFGDTFAYFTGRFLGKKKLYSPISPGKTVVGGLGGLGGSVIGGLTVKALAGLPMGWTQLAIISLLVGAAAQAGDFAESMLKRGAGFKDSGNLLPGHGGMFDRIDGLLFGAPVLYLLWSISLALA